MICNTSTLPTSFHRSAAPKEAPNSSHSIGTNPPGPDILTQSTLWGKGNFGASPALKALGGALIPIGVATIGFGGIGILIIVIGITLWASSTMYSAHESVRPAGQSFSAHIAESIGWAVLGIPLIIGTCLKSYFGTNAAGAHKPPEPTFLNKFTKCCKKIVASPIMKNIAGALTGAGAGAALGCPWLVTLLIGVGVGTSWVGGIGIAIAAAGIILWLISMRLSLNEKPPEQDAAAHIAESAGMAAIGLPCTILETISHCYQWFGERNSSPVQTLSDMRERNAPSIASASQSDTDSASHGLSEEPDNLLLTEKYLQEERNYIPDLSIDR